MVAPTNRSASPANEILEDSDSRTGAAQEAALDTSTGETVIDHTALVDVTNAPSIRAVVVPYVVGGIEAVVIDRPPVPPEISFYPFQGVNNQVEILLNSSTGRITAKPVAIMDGDAEMFEDQYLHQYGNSMSFTEIATQEKTLEFVNDDPVKSYQLFRLTGAPQSYVDFNSAGIVDLDPPYGIPAAFVDILLPNQKYYYCARSRDIHNNLSNPTFVFELELVDNNGQIFLRQEVYTFPTVQAQSTKPGRRFIYVAPSLQQAALEHAQVAAIAVVNTAEAPPDSILGSFDLNETFDPVWEKDFKLRITSKKTGRKLDLNIKFKNSGIVNQTE